MSYPIPSKLNKASKHLCKSILTHFGGSAAVANSLTAYNIESSRQYVHAWIKSGAVPFNQLHDVSLVLNVSQWALSYAKLLSILGDKAPSFEEVVKATPLDPGKKVQILAVK